MNEIEKLCATLDALEVSYETGKELHTGFPYVQFHLGKYGRAYFCMKSDTPWINVVGKIKSMSDVAEALVGEPLMASDEMKTELKKLPETKRLCATLDALDVSYETGEELYTGFPYVTFYFNKQGHAYFYMEADTPRINAVGKVKSMSDVAEALVGKSLMANVELEAELKRQQEENAKMRSLIAYMHRCFVIGHDWGPYCAGETIYVEEQMRELGIEVGQ